MNCFKGKACTATETPGPARETAVGVLEVGSCQAPSLPSLPGHNRGARVRLNDNTSHQESQTPAVSPSMPSSHQGARGVRQASPDQSSSPILPQNVSKMCGSFPSRKVSHVTGTALASAVKASHPRQGASWPLWGPLTCLSPTALINPTDWGLQTTGISLSQSGGWMS